MFWLTDETWFDVLGDRPTDALWGIGAKTAQRLAALGIATVRELAAADPQVLAAQFGPATGPGWSGWRRARATRPSSARAVRAARSRSRETTFQAGPRRLGRGPREVARLARLVADDIAAGADGRTRVVVKVRFAPFFTQHPRSAAPRADRATPRDRAGCARGAGPVHRPAAGAAARRPSRVRAVIGRSLPGVR